MSTGIFPAVWKIKANPFNDGSLIVGIPTKIYGVVKLKNNSTGSEWTVTFGEFTVPSNVHFNTNHISYLSITPNGALSIVTESPSGYTGSWTEVIAYQKESCLLEDAVENFNENDTLYNKGSFKLSDFGINTGEDWRIFPPKAKNNSSADAAGLKGSWGEWVSTNIINAHTTDGIVAIGTVVGDATAVGYDGNRTIWNTELQFCKKGSCPLPYRPSDKECSEWGTRRWASNGQGSVIFWLRYNPSDNAIEWSTTSTGTKTWSNYISNRHSVFIDLCAGGGGAGGNGGSSGKGGGGGGGGAYAGVFVNLKKGPYELEIKVGGCGIGGSPNSNGGSGKSSYLIVRNTSGVKVFEITLPGGNGGGSGGSGGQGGGSGVGNGGNITQTPTSIEASTGVYVYKTCVGLIGGPGEKGSTTTTKYGDDVYITGLVVPDVSVKASYTENGNTISLRGITSGTYNPQHGGSDGTGG